MRGVVRASLGVALALGARGANADPVINAPASRNGGVFASIDTEGRLGELDTTFTMAAPASADAVVAGWLQARLIPFPSVGLDRASGVSLYLGLRTGFFARLGAPPLFGNIEAPIIGLTLHTPRDAHRLELDVAPVFSAYEPGDEAEVAPYAATSLGPSQDYLFVPRLRDGARLRVYYAYRWDLSHRHALRAHLGGVLGFASARGVALPSDNVSGFVGGVSLGLRYQHRWGSAAAPTSSAKGFFGGFEGELGLNTLWPSENALPVRAVVQLGFEIDPRHSVFVEGGVATAGVTSGEFYPVFALRWRVAFWQDRRHLTPIEPILGNQPPTPTALNME